LEPFSLFDGDGALNSRRRVAKPNFMHCTVISADWGRPLPELYEQVLLQRMGYALIMLWPEFPEGDHDFDPDENRTAKERLADRKGRWGER
jgi:hypothetical protein